MFPKNIFNAITAKKITIVWGDRDGKYSDMIITHVWMYQYLTEDTGKITLQRPKFKFLGPT